MNLFLLALLCHSDTTIYYDWRGDSITTRNDSGHVRSFLVKTTLGLSDIYTPFILNSIDSAKTCGDSVFYADMDGITQEEADDTKTALVEKRWNDPLVAKNAIPILNYSVLRAIRLRIGDDGRQCEKRKEDNREYGGTVSDDIITSLDSSEVYKPLPGHYRQVKIDMTRGGVDFHSHPSGKYDSDGLSYSSIQGPSRCDQLKAFDTAYSYEFSMGTFTVIIFWRKGIVGVIPFRHAGILTKTKRNKYKLKR